MAFGCDSVDWIAVYKVVCLSFFAFFFVHSPPCDSYFIKQIYFQFVFPAPFLFDSSAQKSSNAFWLLLLLLSSSLLHVLDSVLPRFLFLVCQPGWVIVLLLCCWVSLCLPVWVFIHPLPVLHSFVRLYVLFFLVCLQCATHSLRSLYNLL